MAIEFEKQPIRWENVGSEPSEDLKTNGFQAGYKPPAGVFNALLNNTSECLTELQTKLSETDDKATQSQSDLELIPITRGGTGATTKKQALLNLGLTEEITKIFSGSTEQNYIINVLTYVGSKISLKSGVFMFNAQWEGHGYGTAIAWQSSDYVKSLILYNAAFGVRFYVWTIANNWQQVNLDGTALEDLSNIDNTVFAEKAAAAGVGGAVGKDLTGQTLVVALDGTTKTAGTGAEIFNDYRARTYDFYDNPLGNVATGEYSHAEGNGVTATGKYSHAEGKETKASGESSHAQGGTTTASGKYSHAGGAGTTASGSYSFAHGSGGTTASGIAAVAMGWHPTASGDYSFATGVASEAKGESAFAAGYGTIANAYQTAIGRYNKESSGPAYADTTGDIFIIGNGTSDSNANITRGNAFRVTTAGKAYGLSNFSGSGADYAEYFEWFDGNPDDEDRRGYFVTLDGEKIRKATEKDEYILGVVSSIPCVVGDVQSEIWHEMYLKDIYGEKIVKVVEVEETTDENGVVIPAHTEKQWVLNPQYDPDKEYISREDRKEWSPVGLMGKLVVRDDGSCQVNGYCKPNGDGIATAAEEGYRVIARLDENHIRVMFR